VETGCYLITICITVGYRPIMR